MQNFFLQCCQGKESESIELEYKYTYVCQWQARTGWDESGWEGKREGGRKRALCKEMAAKVQRTRWCLLPPSCLAGLPACIPANCCAATALSATQPKQPPIPTTTEAVSFLWAHHHRLFQRRLKETIFGIHSQRENTKKSIRISPCDYALFLLHCRALSFRCDCH